MQEFNLIPAEYLEREAIERKCKLFILLFIAVLAGIALAKFVLVQKSGRLQAEIDMLQKGQSENRQQQLQLNDLLARERSLAKRYEILEGLKGGVSAKRIFLAIDRVMNGEVWFSRWTFRRDIQPAESMPSSQQANVIVIPESESGTNKSQVWRINAGMEIDGQALDHSKLASFVGNLIKQPEIADVKVINAALKRYTMAQVVDFKILVTVGE